MEQELKKADRMEMEEVAEQAKPSGSQTLFRGLDVLEAVAKGFSSLQDLAAHVELSRSTTYRLAAALVDRRYLASTPRGGYRLGAKLLELGFDAQSQADIVQVARPHIEALAAATEDTVHLGVLDDDRAFYLDKIAGRRRINISSRVGDRQPLTSTGLGKALLIDHQPDQWKVQFAADQHAGAPRADATVWLDRMTGYATAGRAFDLEENEDQIRCVAAPIRDVRSRIVGAISVSSAAQYMDDARMQTLSDEVCAAARAISTDLGWVGSKKS